MSTYSTSLRIELIGDGEQVNLWGDTTNSNLGTVIEAAITNAVPVLVTTTNFVLSTKNNAPDQARNAVLVINTSGAVTTTFNVFAPPVNKTYIVRNLSAHACVMYCSTVTGDTIPRGFGVTIPAGKTGVIWTDGVNFNFASDTLDSLTIANGLIVNGNATVNGTTTLVGTATAPTPAAGDASTKIATTKFVNDASFDALKDPGSNGMLSRTAFAVVTPRTITGSTFISVANGDGVAGNPTITNTGVTTFNLSTGAVTGFIGGLSSAVFPTTVSNAIGTPMVSVGSGNFTFTVPVGITRLRVTVIGGGGGSGGSVSTAGIGGNSGGGGGGGAAVRVISGLTPGQIISITVGAGGAVGASTAGGGVRGGTGGTSSFGAFVSATGGAGGYPKAIGDAPGGGEGGNGISGTINIAGGPGGNSNMTLNGACPSGASGGNGGNTILGGGGLAATLFGSSVSQPGGLYGGGGAGGINGVFGAGGASGVVIVEY